VLCGDRIENQLCMSCYTFFSLLFDLWLVGLEGGREETLAVMYFAWFLVLLLVTPPQSDFCGLGPNRNLNSQHL